MSLIVPSSREVTSVVPKPRLSLVQIFTMSFGFLGIQFGFALQNGNTSRILRAFGANVEQLPLFWIVAPLVGMVVQPLIGHYSDRTWNRLGRRKPYFLTGAGLSSIALVLIPNSGSLATILPALWIGAGMVMIMDASFNVAMEPFRALVADNLPDRQRTLGFSIQTFLIGLGAVAGSALPEFLGSHDFGMMPRTMKQLGLVQFFSWFALFSMWVFTTDAVATHLYGLTGDYSRSIKYNEAGNKVSSAFGIYNLVAMVYALVIPVIARYIGRKATHAVSLIAGALGLVSIYFIKDPEMLKYCMIGIGLAWASILAMPYVILSGSIPSGKFGIYMGIFNLFITLPQIVNGLLGGWIVKHLYGGHPIFAIVLAGVFLLAAAISVLFVEDPGDPIHARDYEISL